jgi:lycopene cyclase domain-containing protein
MTYLTFHLVFLLPPIIGMTLLASSWRSRLEDIAVAPAIGLIAVIAVVYTTPWDNYLVFKEVWSYGPDRVLATIGYVPVEEYAFFVLQTMLTGLLLVILRASRCLAQGSGSVRGRRLTAVALAVLAVTGTACLFYAKTLYLGLILAWAAPVLLGQWLLGSTVIAKAAWYWFPTVLVSTIYLAAADRIAIALDIWAISDNYTTGIHILGLPVEEFLFFLVTNVLVTWGIILFEDFERRWRIHRTTP